MTAVAVPPEPTAAEAPVILRVRGLVKEFAAPGGRAVHAVAGVDLDVREGEVHALVGESGSGKTTLARCVLGLLDATAGEIAFDGTNVRRARGAELRALRPRMQVVFQDPIGSLDPRMSVLDLVAEPIRAHRHLPGREIGPAVVELLEQVGLGRGHLDRRPHEMSGGQCQRVAIARALALRPRLLVLDEPTSSLDVSVQAQILNLLLELRASHGLTYLLISHDLGVVRHVSDRIAVMYLGRIVEQGPSEEIFAAPRHPYTRALLAAVPDIEDGATAPGLIRGDPPSPASPPTGCRFHPRCWLRERIGSPAACEEVEPPFVRVDRSHDAACHFSERAAIEPIGGPSDIGGAVTLANWHDAPYNRWGYLHVAEIVPVAMIGRGSGPVASLGSAPRDLDALVFRHLDRDHTVARMLRATETDGFLVVHDGAVALEWYADGMTAATPHLLQSVSKSLTATLVGALVDRGRLDPLAPITEQVQELRGTSFEGCTAQHLLDMRAGTRFSEAYEDLDADVRVSEQVCGWRPRTRGGLPPDLYAYMAGLPNARPHGGPFEYRSILTDMLGWVAERAAGTTFADAFSREVWSRLGAEHAASVTVDAGGCALADGGFSITLRDLGRFGWMHLQDGELDARRVVPGAWIGRLLRPDAELAATFGGALVVPGVTGPNTMYHDQWWVLDPAAGIYVAIGIHGQMLLVHRPTRTVVVKLATQPQPVDRAVFAYQMAGSLAICRELAGGG